MKPFDVRSKPFDVLSKNSSRTLVHAGLTPRAGVPKPPGTSLVAGGRTYLENPLCDNRLCALALAQRTNLGGRRADGRREK